MSIRWIDGRGKTVILVEERWRHILEGHAEFDGHIDWCQSAVEQAQEVRADPVTKRGPGERYVGPRLTRGFFAGAQPVVAVKVNVDDTRFVKTAFLTTLDEPGPLIWTPSPVAPKTPQSK